MKTATVSDFRARMKEHLEEIQKDQDVLILSGPKKKHFVVLTLQQYNAMEETAHLLSTPANTAWLLESLAQANAGQVAHSFKVEYLNKGSEKNTRSKSKTVKKAFKKK